MADNRLCNKAAGKALATMLAGNTTLKEFDVSKNSYAGCDGPGFAQEFADGIRNNGALEKLLMGNNRIATKEAGKAIAEAMAHNSVLKELDLSSNNWDHSMFVGGDKGDGPGFAKELADGLKNNGALTSLNISNNMLGGKYSDGSGGDAPYTAAGLKALCEMLQTNTDLHIAI